MSFVLAVVYGYSTGGNRLGPLTAGYYGGVGDHLGYTLLRHDRAWRRSLLGIIAVVTRDADPSALAELAGTDEAPPAVAPAYPSLLAARRAPSAPPWSSSGLVISNVLFMVGLLPAAWPCSWSGWCWPGPTTPPATPRRTTWSAAG